MGKLAVFINIMFGLFCSYGVAVAGTVLKFDLTIGEISLAECDLGGMFDTEACYIKTENFPKQSLPFFGTGEFANQIRHASKSIIRLKKNFTNTSENFSFYLDNEEYVITDRGSQMIIPLSASSNTELPKVEIKTQYSKNKELVFSPFKAEIISVVIELDMSPIEDLLAGLATQKKLFQTIQESIAANVAIITIESNINSAVASLTSAQTNLESNYELATDDIEKTAIQQQIEVVKHGIMALAEAKETISNNNAAAAQKIQENIDALIGQEKAVQTFLQTEISRITTDNQSAVTQLQGIIDALNKIGAK